MDVIYRRYWIRFRMNVINTFTLAYLVLLSVFPATYSPECSLRNEGYECRQVLLKLKILFEFTLLGYLFAFSIFAHKKPFFHFKWH